VASSMTPLASFVDGTSPNAAALNTIPTNINALTDITTGKQPILKPAAPPSVWVYMNRNYNVTDNFAQNVLWHAADMITDNGLWAPVIPDWVTIQTPGMYVARAQVFFAARQGGYRSIGITLNEGRSGGGHVGQTSLGATVGNDCPMMVRSYPFPGLPGDIVQLKVYQTSGSTLPLQGAPDPKSAGGGTWMSVRWIAPTPV
jgi:hypothetical protein